MGDRENDRVLVETVAENMRVYSKREISGATKARDMLDKMGYPPISEAISIIGNGKNFDIAAHDFAVADAIWGADIATLKGKTVKSAPIPSDSTMGPVIAHPISVCITIRLYTSSHTHVPTTEYPTGCTPYTYSLQRQHSSSSSVVSKT